MFSIVSFSDFCDSFSDTYKNNFSYEGKRALFDYLEQLEEDTDEKIELDTVALCCEYSEYDDLEDVNKQLGKEYEDIDELRDDTQVIECENGHIIIQDF